MSIDWDIQLFPELASTQDLCKELAVGGGPEGTVVQTFSQSGGKGRHGRAWISAPGNLALSFILRPGCPVSSVGQLSILTGVAVAQTVGEAARVKWPNDVLIDGRKCAGILMDSGLKGAWLEWLVVGIGVNTASAPKMAAALHVDRDGFRDGLLDNISKFYAAFRQDGFTNIRDEWLGRTYSKGTALNVGDFETIDNLGNLIVRDGQNRLKTISAGDVFIKDQDYAAGD
ncbi:MAG: biotin--[acetyl-CoA-carboxylase] ligase [Rhodospirillales bacterium]|nr:biotin--[acetyl-CoA-carboxylase] ligase [Rhodospirillales bacterium]